MFAQATQSFIWVQTLVRDVVFFIAAALIIHIAWQVSANPWLRTIGAIAAIALLALITWQPMSDTAKSLPERTTETVPSPPNQTQQPPVVQKEQKPAREIINVTPEEIREFARNKSLLQAQQLYTGKWIRVFDRVGEVSRYSDPSSLRRMLLRFEGKGSDQINYALWVFFSDEWSEKLSLLSRGDAITVLCQITEINSNEIQLTHCELIEVKSQK
jgi:hypothetical protein